MNASGRPRRTLGLNDPPWSDALVKWGHQPYYILVHGCASSASTRTQTSPITAVEMNLSDCQLWEGPMNITTGYGNACFSRGPVVGAHRLAFAMGHGVDPAGKVVMHTCDTRLCLNPEHLVLGTHKENTQDMISKGRGANKRFCKRGHDTWVVGRRRVSRNCVACPS